MVIADDGVPPGILAAAGETTELQATTRFACFRRQRSKSCGRRRKALKSRDCGEAGDLRKDRDQPPEPDQEVVTSLTQQLGSGGNPPSAAQFAAKANLTDVTNPTAPISIEGGASFQMTMRDNGEPGSSDQIGFTLYSSSNQLLFSSSWDGTKTVEQILGGGNVVIH
jgi:hypothetical protein